MPGCEKTWKANVQFGRVRTIRLEKIRVKKSIELSFESILNNLATVLFEQSWRVSYNLAPARELRG